VVPLRHFDTAVAQSSSHHLMDVAVDVDFAFAVAVDFSVAVAVFASAVAQ